jgi:hypothetical protein
MDADPLCSALNDAASAAWCSTPAIAASIPLAIVLFQSIASGGTGAGLDEISVTTRQARCGCGGLGSLAATAVEHTVTTRRKRRTLHCGGGEWWESHLPAVALAASPNRAHEQPHHVAAAGVRRVRLLEHICERLLRPGDLARLDVVVVVPHQLS